MSKWFPHFSTLLWKCYILELDSVSKYIWSIATAIIFGLVFGPIARYTSDTSILAVVMYAFMIFQCGIVGRMVGINLVRDRQIKFRLTLQLVGVQQSSYLASNYVFSLIWGFIQIVILLVTIMVMYMFLIGSDGGVKPAGGKFDFMDFVEYFFSTGLFLLAFLAMCSAFSAIIKQYEYASDIIGKFTFLSMFIPISYAFSGVVSALNSRNTDDYLKLVRLDYKAFWMPNIIYLQIGMRKGYLAIMNSARVVNIPPELQPGSLMMFNGILFAQFIAYLLIYYILDRYISTDTGAQRQIIGTAKDQLEDAPNLDVSGDTLRQQLLPGQEGTINNQTAMIVNKIKIRNLVKNYGDFCALKNINLDLGPNIITCLLGHNGAGKTTLIDIITCFQEPSQGGVYFNGTNIHTNADMLYGKVGYASSHDPLFEEISVRNFLELIARLKNIPDYQNEALKIARETHLEIHYEKKVRDCSGGTKRRVSIASALIGDPLLIFLDEPSTGVDPENRRALWECITHMKRSDRIIMMTTHHLEEAEFLSRDVIILSKGEVAVRGAPDEIKAHLGVGYKFIVTGMHDKRDYFYSVMSPFASYMVVNEDKFASLGELRVEMKKGTQEVVAPIISLFEQNRFAYSILQSTLEDAFINLGEKDASVQEEQARDQVIQSLFTKRFTTDNVHKFVALVIRKIFLLFQSLLQVIVLVLLIAVPVGVYYMIIIITDSSINSNNNTGNRKLIPVKLVGLINIICIIYYTFSCGFFGLTPAVERLSRIRYLMKMNNVTWVAYLPTLLLPDMLISAFLTGITYLVAIVATKKFLEPAESGVIMTFGLNLYIWMMTFIAQSYFLSFFFSTKEGAYKRLTNIILYANIGAVVILSYLVQIRSEVFQRVILKIFNVLFPGYANIGYVISQINSNNSLNISGMQDILIYSSICFVLFFSAALFMDYRDSKITRPDDVNTVKDPNSAVAGVYDPTTVANELELAFQNSNEYPIQVQSVSKQFGSFYALGGVSFALRPTEVLGLIGPNGAGKTTMFNIVSNYLSPTKGTIKYHGRFLDESPDFYNKTGLCAQDDIIWPELSVDQHLQFYSKLKGVDHHSIEIWKKLLGLGGFGSFMSSHLSTGMKRKLCYIISMMTNPLYKFLDEPTSGLDPVSRKLMRKLILDQKKIYGGSCVFTTHTMRDAEDLCDRVAILVNGKLTCIDTVNNLRTKTGGMNISFLRNLAHPNLMLDEQNIFTAFTQVFPESLEYGKPVVVDRTDRKIVFYAPKIELLSAKIDSLMKLKSQGILYDFEVSERSLEDLFLYLARNQQARVF